MLWYRRAPSDDGSFARGQQFTKRASGQDTTHGLISRLIYIVRTGALAIERATQEDADGGRYRNWREGWMPAG